MLKNSALRGALNLIHRPRIQPNRCCVLTPTSPLVPFCGLDGVVGVLAVLFVLCLRFSALEVLVVFLLVFEVDFRQKGLQFERNGKSVAIGRNLGQGAMAPRIFFRYRGV